MGTHLRIKRYADISVVELCSTFRVLGELAYGRQIVKFKDYYKITTEDNNVSLMKIVDNHALVSVVGKRGRRKYGCKRFSLPQRI